MEAILLMGFLSLITGLITTSINNDVQREFNQDQFDYQKQYYDYTFDKQNQYNLPSEQIARLKEAGLNPNLAYGQVQPAGSSGQSGSLPNAKINPINLGQMDFSGMLNAAANDKQSESQVELNKAITQGKLIENAFNAKRYGGNEGNRLAAALLKQAENQADYGSFLNDKILVETNNEIIRSAILVAQERNIKANTTLTILQGITEGVKPDLIFKQIQDIDSQISERDANIAYLSMMKELTKGKSEYQEKLNKNFDQMTSRQLAVLASEIYRNYTTRSEVSFPLVGGSYQRTDRPGNIENLYHEPLYNK